MKVAIYTGAGGPEVIRFGERAAPAPGPNDVRVRVHAAGLNRADILQRKGRYPAPAGWPPDVPGLEFAGEIVECGAGVGRWRSGARVMGLVGGGAMAEELVVHADELLAVPEGIELATAAAIPEAFLTAWDALTVRGRLQPGERVLVHAVASGVGTAAMQVALLLGAGGVAGTSRTAEKLARCRALGLDEAIDTRADPAFANQLRAPVDVILDLLGAGAFDENLRALATHGRLVMLGLLQGTRGQVDLALVVQKRLEIIGSIMRSRPPNERRALVASAAARLLPAFASGRLVPVVHAVLPMHDLAYAHECLERDETMGKLVLTW